MDQMQMKYWEMDVWKVNEFNVLNEEVEEFTSSWIQNLVNVRNPSYLKQKIFEYFLGGLFILFSFLFGHRDVLLVWVKYTYG